MFLSGLEVGDASRFSGQTGLTAPACRGTDLSRREKVTNSGVKPLTRAIAPLLGLLHPYPEFYRC